MQAKPQFSDDPSQIDKCLSQLKAGFNTGVTRNLEWRKQQLMKIKKGCQEKQQVFAEALKKDLGKNEFVGKNFELNGITGEVDHCLKNLDKWAKDQIVDTPLTLAPARSKIIFEPYGVTLVLGAWNFPFILSFQPAIQAIAAGNCVLIKPSEHATHSMKAMVEFFKEYMDPNYFQCVEGGIEVGKKLITCKFDLIFFTGGTSIGRLVAIEAAKNLVPCVLELGGKSPAVVDSNSDVDFAALKILSGRVTNCGQICVAPDYVLCQESVVDKLQDRLKHHLNNFFPDKNDTTDLGKIIDERNFNRLLKFQDKANHGGKVITGDSNNRDKLYIEPTIILKPKLDSLCMTEEIFGPILPIQTYNKIDDAIKFINERDKPLTMYYFGKVNNNANKERLMRETSSGGFVVNETILQLANPDLPFGGVGASGQGKYHGECGFKAFSHGKSVLVKPALNIKPLNTLCPPWTQSKQNMVNSLLGKPPTSQQKLVTNLVLIFSIIVILISVLLYYFFNKN